MATPRELCGAGISFSGVGIVFVAIAATGHPAFLGVGLACFGLALACPGRAGGAW